jgi:hypothetical protein
MMDEAAGPSIAITGAQLPLGFEALGSFVPRWSATTTQQRWDQRSSASMQDIREFYDAMLAEAPKALAYLDHQPLDALSPQAGCLLRLLLSLANCAMAVELHGAARAPNSPFPHGVTVVKGGFPFG